MAAQMTPTTENSPLRIAVIGGGAAGMMAAITAARSGAQVTVFDKNERAGRKIGITGKGRCNLTNRCSVSHFIEQIQSNPRFLYTAAAAFPPSATMEFFESLGVPLKVERGERVFPVSDRAGDIVYAMVKEMRRLGCVYRVEPVRHLLLEEDGSIRGIRSDKGETEFDRVIVCTGGASYPTTGSTGDGSRMAAEIGMETVALRPSLVPLVVSEEYCREMQGLSLKNTALTLLDTQSGKILYEDFGEMLFTHFGVSGPMILSASAHLKQCPSGRYKIFLDLKPALDEKMLDNRLLSDFAKYKNRDFSNALCDLLPQKMIPVIVRLSKIAPDKKVHSLTKGDRGTLISLLKNFPLTVQSYRPIDEAIVTAGGVSVKEINPRTMEAKRHPGLYFAGETLDVDAYTGGFNLQIAFATGHLAGYSAARKKEIS